VVNALATGKPVEDDREAPEQRSTPARIATRITAAIAAIMADPAVALSPGELDRCMALRRGFENLFTASAFDGPEFALRAMPVTEPFRAHDEMDAAALAKYLVLLSLDADVALDVEQVLALPPRLAQLVYLNLLATKPVLTAAGEARRERLLALADRLVPAELPPTVDHVVLIASAWMLCSYARSTGKHRVKAVLNRVLRDLLGRLGLEDAPAPAARREVDRPVLVIASEIMHSNHVQYRYFGQYCRQLRERFETILICEKREIDRHVEGLFDRTFGFVRTSNGIYLRQIVDFIGATRPDMIYWPSIGMRHWGVTLANLRLAPIQLMGLGHTATTHLDTIDYCIAEAGLVGDPGCYQEKLVLIPDEAHILERSPHYRPVAPVIRERPDPLRIAIASNLLKINPSFLTFLAALRDAAGRQLEFHLFPNVGGLELTAARKGVQRILPEAVLHPMLPYNLYLERLNACDLSFSPFPFGGMHSVIDSIRQGLPVVALQGQEPHARTDAMLLRRFAMPDCLIARTEADYATQALRLIRDDAHRIEVSRRALAADVDRRIYARGKPARHEMADAVWWIYQNHEAIQADGRQVWTMADRSPLSAAAGPGEGTTRIQAATGTLEIVLEFTR
jgi:predicted O-linked N-acetylglucosamine transferase (SPINDLY family)